MLGRPAVLALASVLGGEVDLPGTQPNELGNPPAQTTACTCHLSFDPGFIEPGETYRATAMALSARDPLFRAALEIAARDRPQYADLCLRCHAPVGWLSGRSTPGDGTALLESDLESITCDVCHRMIATPTGEQLVGSGQYTLSNSTAKRALRGASPVGGHLVEASTFTGSSELCAACHSLFNPAELGHDAAGVELGQAYYEQRTYEEWRDSDFNRPGGKTCADCHLQRVRGRAAMQGAEYADLAQHAIVGANDFVALAINLLEPSYPIANELDDVLALVDQSLRSSVRLSVTSTHTRPAAGAGGDALDLSVRVENLTGHKLPTGYPEGRRVYLEVELALAGGATLAVSGAWDRATGDLVPDPQLRTYETQHGRFEGGASQRTHHLLLMNQVLTDTRIPPRGFSPTEADMIPAGRDYGPAPHRHYDEVSYRVPLPEVTEPTPATLRVRARYQLLDGEVVRFLTGELGPGSIPGAKLLSAWEALGHLPPREMAAVELPVVITPRPLDPPDAGQLEDAGTHPDGAPGGVRELGGGCSCLAGPGGRARFADASLELEHRASSGASPLLFGLAALVLAARRGPRARAS